MRSYITRRYQRVVIKDNVCNKSTSKWELVKHGVPQGSVLGPLLFLIYINDLPRILNSVANPTLFADDTSIIISNTDSQEFLNNINTVTNDTINWFQRNLLSMNSDKTHLLQFMTKKKTKGRENKNSVSNSIITNTNSTKFLGLTIDNTLSWKERTANVTSKSNGACYATRAIKPCLTLDVLRMVYFSYFHSITSYGIIFWGNSHLSSNIFKIQKE